MQDAEIRLAKQNGKYDECGIIKPHGESITFKKKEVLLLPWPSIQCCHAEAACNAAELCSQPAFICVLILSI